MPRRSLASFLPYTQVGAKKSWITAKLDKKAEYFYLRPNRRISGQTNPPKTLIVSCRGCQIGHICGRNGCRDSPNRERAPPSSPPCVRRSYRLCFETCIFPGGSSLHDSTPHPSTLSAVKPKPKKRRLLFDRAAVRTQPLAGKIHIHVHGSSGSRGYHLHRAFHAVLARHIIFGVRRVLRSVGICTHFVHFKRLGC